MHNEVYSEIDSNGCTKNNGGCQQLCLPLPGNPPRICRCTSGFDLSADGKTCLGKSIRPFLPSILRETIFVHFFNTWQII